MVLANTSVLEIKWTPKFGYHQRLHSQRESQLPSAFRRLSKISKSDPIFSQITASVGSWSRRFCVSLSRANFCFLQPSSSPICKFHWLSAKCSWCRIPSLGAQRDLDTQFLGKNFSSFDYPPVCEFPTWGYGTLLHLHLSYSPHCRSFIISSVVKRLFLVFRPVL